MNNEAMTCIGSIALLCHLVLSLTAWLSPRHPAQRRPAIVLVPFGTPPDHDTLIFLFVKERAAINNHFASLSSSMYIFPSRISLFLKGRFYYVPGK